MMMLTTLAILLLLNAVWNVVVWPRFYKRVSQDGRARDAAGKPTSFLIVHAVLVGVSLLLAAASAVVAVLALVNG
ncbi:putative membrane protein [Cryobacterium sp. MP_3.1]|nr:putative membrane protein [Cryobacterium sp. MP_3.1]